MSGHSKWNNIKHKKEKTDSQRARVFTKIGREIAIAVKEGGADPNVNSKLRDVVAKAKANNMPNDNISRSIAKASGELGNVSYEEIVYEGYGNGGVALMVETLTDNRNRTASDVRHLFDKFGNGLGTTGCVSYMFSHQGVIAIEKKEDMDEDEVMMAALDAGAENFEATEEEFIVYTDIASFSQVREKLEEGGYTFTSAELEWVPQTMVSVAGTDADKLDKLVENLEDLDDVQNVFHNGEME
ncbi:MAG: YebC/PmpR family DNA-binding transcriptional regulator [Clostridiales bacterium]|nr:YebC/PmpR family DNA-binding transcriptional regulator [Clostridiales bacterium]